MIPIAELAFPFDAGAGANSTEDRWRLMGSLWLKSGVIRGELLELQGFGDSSGLQVKLRTGVAWVKGHYYSNDATLTKTVASNSSGSTRIDRLVIRADFTANTIAAWIIQGTPGAGAPALTQSSTVWDVPIAQVTVTNGAATISPANVAEDRVWANDRDGFIICTSTTRPLAPWKGLLIYETDTEKVYRWNGTAWNLPKNVAGGRLGYATNSSDQSGITAVADIVGCSVVVTVGAGRWIKISAHAIFTFTSGTGDSRVIGSIKEGSTILRRFADEIMPINREYAASDWDIEVPSAGSHTYKLTAERVSGDGNLMVRGAGAGLAASILVEDIGSA